MSSTKLVITFLMMILPLPTLAYIAQEGNVSAIIGPYFHKTDYQGTPERPTSPILGGTSLAVFGDLNDHSTLEVSLAHLNKVFYRDEGENFLAQQTQMMHITIGYRYWFNHTFCAGLGLYSAYQMGQVEEVYRKTSTNPDITTSATDASEFGFDMSLLAEVWSSGRWAVDLDGKYTRSATNKNQEHGDHYGMILGIRYFIQGK